MNSTDTITEFHRFAPGTGVHPAALLARIATSALRAVRARGRRLQAARLPADGCGTRADFAPPRREAPTPFC